jgi:RNA polymerase-binding transcription factor DksA
MSKAPAKAKATKSAKAPVKARPVTVAKSKTKPALKPVAKAVAAKPAKPAVPGKPQLVQGSILKHGAAHQKHGKQNGKAIPAHVPTRTMSRPASVVRAPKPAPAMMNRPVPVMVTSGGKPKKNQAGLTVRELEIYRDLLLAKRRELVGDMGSMEAEALRSGSGSNLSNLPIHMADMGTDNYEQEFTLGLVEKDRVVLREINQPLAKIQDGTYGICEGTGKPIGKPRLEVQPWAKYSIEYARMLEKRMMR